MQGNTLLDSYFYDKMHDQSSITSVAKYNYLKLHTTSCIFFFKMRSTVFNLNCTVAMITEKKGKLRITESMANFDDILGLPW